jgi:hypothetical protein
MWWDFFYEPLFLFSCLRYPGCFTRKRGEVAELAEISQRRGAPLRLREKGNFEEKTSTGRQ